jgi:hypothetical protein
VSKAPSPAVVSARPAGASALLWGWRSFLLVFLLSAAWLGYLAWLDPQPRNASQLALTLLAGMIPAALVALPVALLRLAWGAWGWWSLAALVALVLLGALAAGGAFVASQWAAVQPRERFRFALAAVAVAVALIVICRVASRARPILTGPPPEEWPVEVDEGTWKATVKLLAMILAPLVMTLLYQGFVYGAVREWALWGLPLLACAMVPLYLYVNRHRAPTRMDALLAILWWTGMHLLLSFALVVLGVLATTMVSKGLYPWAAAVVLMLCAWGLWAIWFRMPGLRAKPGRRA